MPPIKKTKNQLKKSSKTVSKKERNAKVPIKKFTKAQNERLNKILAKSPPIEKLHPDIYSKLQSSINNAVEKTMPEYKKWLNSQFGEKVVAEDCDCSDCGNDCPKEICSSCGNDCPREICSSCGNDCPREICSSCGNDCPREICSSCGNDCPSPVGHISDRIRNEVISAAMAAAVKSALVEAASKESGKGVSEAKMRADVKKQLMKAAKEIGKNK